MERIGIEDARLNLADIIKRVESGKEIMLTRYGRDIAHITMPDIKRTRKTNAFFALLKRMKKHASISATSEEIKQWIEDGRT